MRQDHEALAQRQLFAELRRASEAVQIPAQRGASAADSGRGAQARSRQDDPAPRAPLSDPGRQDRLLAGSSVQGDPRLAEGATALASSRCDDMDSIAAVVESRLREGRIAYSAATTAPTDRKGRKARQKPPRLARAHRLKLRGCRGCSTDKINAGPGGRAGRPRRKRQAQRCRHPRGHQAQCRGRKGCRIH